MNCYLAIPTLLLAATIGLAQPGSLIGYEQIGSMEAGEIETALNIAFGMDAPTSIYSISMYSITYEIQTSDGTTDTLSGAVAFPHDPTRAFPIASYQHGTTILDNNVPSITGLSADNLEITLIAMIASSNGFITGFPDYMGLGISEGYHPYIIADSYTLAVTNLVRAIKHLAFEIDPIGSFQWNNQLYLLGYSEGGYATMAAQKGIEESLLDELPITASFPMAGPYDLAGTMVDYFLSIPDYPQPYYVPNVLFTHLDYYGSLDDIDQYFLPVWADTLPILFDGTHSGWEINDLMPENPLDILLPGVLEEFLEDEEHFFRLTLLENTLLDWVPLTPTYLIHGMGDDIVPYANAEVAYIDFILGGALDVTLVNFSESEGGHADLALPCIFEAYEIMLQYQELNSKGDMDGDGGLSEDDIELLVQHIINGNGMRTYESWAGDWDYDNINSIFDLTAISLSID